MPRLARVRVRTDPPLGLGEAELARLARVADRLLAGRPLLAHGHHPARRRAGHGTEFLDHREYAPGDDLRHVDWRASARSRKPQVRRYREETSADWYLCLDRSASMSTVGAAKWRLAQQLAGALAYVLLHLGNRVGLLVYSSAVDQVIRPGRGQRQFARLIQGLSSLPPRSGGGRSRPGTCARLLGPRNPVVVLSDFLGESGSQAELSRLYGNGREMHALLVRAAGDLALPLTGAVLLEDIETGLRARIQAAERTGAAACSDQLRDDLGSYCRRRRIAFTGAWADAPWQQVAVEHLKNTARLLG